VFYRKLKDCLLIILETMAVLLYAISFGGVVIAIAET
jgi:hypothetical protein